MTKTQAQILELFETLADDERRVLAEQLYATTAAGSFYDQMTPEARAELLAAIAEADRGEGTPADRVFAQLKQKHGLMSSK